MKDTISQFHAPAVQSGVKIVHCCGWDCLPADLGALLIARHAQEKLGRSVPPHCFPLPGQLTQICLVILKV